MTAPAIALRDARRHYRTPAGIVRAIDGVDLDVDAGERVAVMGPSGSGKSTLLSLVGALEPPSGGAVEVLGVDLGSLSDARRAAFRRGRVGFIFQDYDLLAFLTAVENVALGAGVADVAAPLDARALLDRLGMAGHEDKLPDQLSGGQQQRVDIARSLAARPALLLADEPTGSLDAATSQTVIDILLELTAELDTTALVVTHDPAIAERMDRVVNLRDGRVADGRPGRQSRPSGIS